MAVYDFLCLDCGETFAVDSRKPIEDPCVHCARCGSKTGGPGACDRMRA